METLKYKYELISDDNPDTFDGTVTSYISIKKENLIKPSDLKNRIFQNQRMMNLRLETSYYQWIKMN